MRRERPAVGNHRTPVPGPVGQPLQVDWGRREVDPTAGVRKRDDPGMSSSKLRRVLRTPGPAYLDGLFGGVGSERTGTRRRSTLLPLTTSDLSTTKKLVFSIGSSCLPPLHDLWHVTCCETARRSFSSFSIVVEGEGVERTGGKRRGHLRLHWTERTSWILGALLVAFGPRTYRRNDNRICCANRSMRPASAPSHFA